jgi:cell division protein ZapB
MLTPAAVVSSGNARRALPWLRCRFRQPAFVDHSGVRLYDLWPMSDTGKATVEQELKRLERRIDDLVTTVGQLKDENRALRQRQDTLTAERATLLQKNEQVRARVEAMIGRLKAMEHGT